jgi:hypothetical protein
MGMITNFEVIIENFALTLRHRLFFADFKIHTIEARIGVAKWFHLAVVIMKIPNLQYWPVEVDFDSTSIVIVVGAALNIY